MVARSRWRVAPRTALATSNRPWRTLLGFERSSDSCSTTTGFSLGLSTRTGRSEMQSHNLKPILAGAFALCMSILAAQSGELEKRPNAAFGQPISAADLELWNI